MTSKHYGWQKRWTLDQAARTAVHECGLVVSFAGNDGKAEPINFEEVRPGLELKHGPHNVPQMLARWLREAQQLIDRR